MESAWVRGGKSFYRWRRWAGGATLAQPVEHPPCKRKVGSSILPGGSLTSSAAEVRSARPHGWSPSSVGWGWHIRAESLGPGGSLRRTSPSSLTAWSRARRSLISWRTKAVVVRPRNRAEAPDSPWGLPSTRAVVSAGGDRRHLRSGERIGHAVELLVASRTEGSVGCRRPPGIPEQKLFPVECGQVEQQSSTDEPQPPGLSVRLDPETLRIDALPSAHQPRPAADQKPRPGHVHGVEVEAILPHQPWTLLGVYQLPAVLGRFPHLRNRVICVETRWRISEVRREAHANPTRNPTVSRHGAEEDGKVPTASDEPMRQRSGPRERSRFELYQARQHAVDIPHVDLPEAALLDAGGPKIRVAVMDQESLHDLAETGDIRRDVLEEFSARSGRRERTLARVVAQLSP